MGLPSRLALHARYRNGTHRLDDRGQAPHDRRRAGWIAGGCLIFCAGLACAEPLRIATFNVELAREGPGLLLRDILKGEDADIAAAQAVIAHVDPDILVLQGFDYDAGGAALSAFNAALGYPVTIAWRSNTGEATPFDLDGDGRRRGARDAQGYGEFAGQGGMAILSRFTFDSVRSVDYSAMLWRDLPGHIMPDMAPEIAAAQRLSTTGHWRITFDIAGSPLTVMTFHATPPVFDGPEDRNGRRNHDEVMFWHYLLDGTLGEAPQGPLVILGDANLDPADGDGRSEAMRALLSHPRLQDPAPRSEGGTHAAERDGGMNVAQRGDPALDTADWPDAAPWPGNLRVDYVLPSRDLTIIDSGVFWPGPEDPQVVLLGEGDVSRHRLVWVDLMLGR